MANLTSQRLRHWNMDHDTYLRKELLIPLSGRDKSCCLPSSLQIIFPRRMTALLPLMPLMLYTGIVKVAMAMLPFAHWNCFFFWSFSLVVVFEVPPTTWPYSEIPSSLEVDTQDIVNALSGFPYRSSPEVLNLWAQCLLNTMCGHVTPATQDCLQVWLSELT